MTLAFSATESRVYPLDGASNFRDIGGYATAQGQVQKGRLFRSDQIANLSPQDLDLLRKLNIQCSLDFRGTHEYQRSAYDYDFIDHQMLTVEPTIVQDLGRFMQSTEGLDGEKARSVMKKTYVEFVQHHTAQFSRVFQHLLQGPHNIVLHCTAGKDRTGFAVALIHQALGVHPDDLMQDYLLSAQLFKRPDLPDNRGLSEEVLDVVWGVEADYLHAAFQEIERQYGSFEAYFEQALQFTPQQQAQLRATYIV